MQDQTLKSQRPPAFEAHFRKECGMPDQAQFQWEAPHMVAALDGWNAHAAQLEQALGQDFENSREERLHAVKRAISAAFGIALNDNPKLDAAAMMAIAAMEAEHPPGDSKILSPADAANDNAAFVVMQRITDAFDSEQAQQALEALNRSQKED